MSYLRKRVFLKGLVRCMALISAGKLGDQEKLSVLMDRTFSIIRLHTLSNIGWFESSNGKLHKHISLLFELSWF